MDAHRSGHRFICFDQRPPFWCDSSGADRGVRSDCPLARRRRRRVALDQPASSSSSGPDFLFSPLPTLARLLLRLGQRTRLDFGDCRSIRKEPPCQLRRSAGAARAAISDAVLCSKSDNFFLVTPIAQFRTRSRNRSTCIVFWFLSFFSQLLPGS